MTDASPRIAVYIVTYRRNALLRRSLASALAQSHRNLVVHVVNDDPTDAGVARIVEEARDPRVRLYQPVEKRGATRNFNLMFQDGDAGFVSLLEDDNWWAPTFLETMVATLQSRPDHLVAVGNERVWREKAEGSWEDTGDTIWPFDDTREHAYSVEEICGSAKLCNSSMLVRLPEGRVLLTPDTIPVDVTEHFRERLIASPLLLNGQPLVNYAETLTTARASRGETWGIYQLLLTGSVFSAIDEPGRRRELARRLWANCPSPTSPRAVSLVATGFAIGEARALVSQAPLKALARFLVWLVRRPSRWASITGARSDRQAEFDFLTAAPLTRRVAEGVR